MQKIVTFLKGKKTFAVAVVMVLYALVVVGWQGKDWVQATELVMAALGLSALRDGIKK